MSAKYIRIENVLDVISLALLATGVLPSTRFHHMHSTDTLQSSISVCMLRPMMIMIRPCD